MARYLQSQENGRIPWIKRTRSSTAITTSPPWPRH